MTSVFATMVLSQVSRFSKAAPKKTLKTSVPWQIMNIQWMLIFVKYANAISAKITVPMHYSTPRSQIDVSDASIFLKRIAGVEYVDSSVDIDCYLNQEENSVLVFNTDKL